MSLMPMAVRHLDLSAASPPDMPVDGRPVLACLWWRDLPLGIMTGSREELPFSRPALDAFLVRAIAEQRAARDPALGAPLIGGAEGDPHRALSLNAAGECDNFEGWLDEATSLPPRPADDLSVIVCTRDRSEALRHCLAALTTQQSPPGEIVVVDNAPDGSAREVCEGVPMVRYVHEPAPGLSHARNAGIAAASKALIAFTDDDVAVRGNWTSEVVRALEDSGAEAMTGLVLPIRLETPAQTLFQVHLGGFGNRFVPVRYDRAFYAETCGDGAHVWRIGAGANMAFRASVFDRVGLFDARLGAGASGCSEDSEFWYRILATGGTIQYEPRAVVFHDHRADLAGLKRQMRAYLHGHVSALVAQADMFSDKGNLRRIAAQIPRDFLRAWIETVETGESERRAIVHRQLLGWMTGTSFLLRRRWRRSGPPRPATLSDGGVPSLNMATAPEPRHNGHHPETANRSAPSSGTPKASTSYSNMRSDAGPPHAALLDDAGGHSARTQDEPA